MGKNKQVFAGIHTFGVDDEKGQMTITLNVSSADFGIDKYQKVYHTVRNALIENGYCGRGIIEAPTSSKV